MAKKPTLTVSCCEPSSAAYAVCGENIIHTHTKPSNTATYFFALEIILNLLYVKYISLYISLSTSWFNKIALPHQIHLSLFTVHINGTSHCLNQILSNSHTKSGSLYFVCNGTFRTGKRIKNSSAAVSAPFRHSIPSRFVNSPIATAWMISLLDQSSPRSMEY